MDGWIGSCWAVAESNLGTLGIAQVGSRWAGPAGLDPDIKEPKPLLESLQAG